MNLQFERKRRLMTQHDMAASLGISQARISLIEKGYYSLTPELKKKIHIIFKNYDKKEISIGK